MSAHQASSPPRMCRAPSSFRSTISTRPFFGSSVARRETPVYVLCQSGGRARQAIERLERAGVHGCVLVEGGTQGWMDAGLPVESRPEQRFAADAPSANHCRISFQPRARFLRLSSIRSSPLSHWSWAAVFYLPGSLAPVDWRCCWQKCHGIMPKAAVLAVKQRGSLNHE